MKFYEILIIIGAIAIVLGNILVYIYKKKKHLPTGECACCSSSKKMDKMLDSVRKELEEEKCSCNCN